jgi:predicted metal-dependent HD superfamily phosphohydrolase
MIDLATMRGRFGACLPPGCPATVAARAFDEIVAAYSEPHRHYHTLAHIDALLALTDTQRAAFARADLVDLAVFYHDAVYEIGRRDNEEASARLAAQRLPALGLTASDIERVVSLIEATAHGQHVDTSADPDRDRFIDFDLSILAAEPPHYRGYTHAIRQEYASIPDRDYRAGRARILQGFLAQPALYRCADLAARWEAAARANIAAEIAELTS